MDEECQLTDEFRGIGDGFPKALSYVSSHFTFHVSASCFFIAFFPVVYCCLCFYGNRLPTLFYMSFRIIHLFVDVQCWKRRCRLIHAPITTRTVATTGEAMFKYCGRILESDSYINFQSPLGFQQ
jgi:hypothetical protein